MGDVMKLCLTLRMVAGVSVLSGCHASQPKTDAKPVSGPERIYTFAGQSWRPKFINNRTKQIEFVEVGELISSAHGDGPQGSGEDRSYKGGRIGFADSSTLKFREIMTGQGWGDKDISFVEGKD